MDQRQDRVTPESERIQREIDDTRNRIDDTACAIQDRLSFRGLAGDFVDLLAGGAGIGSRRAIKGIRDNPIPAALVGLGIAWLLADRAATSRTRRTYATFPDEGRGRVGQKLHEGAEAASDMAHRAGERISSAVSSARESVMETASAVGDTVRDAASTVGHKVRDTAAGISDRVHSTAAHAREQVSHLTGRARDMAQSARRTVADTYEENPLIIGAAAFAVGLIGGLAVPSCAAENRLMGRASKNLKQRVKDIGGQAMHAGQQVASRAVEAARQAGAEGEGAVERVANAAEAALSTAAQETASRTRSIAQGRPPGQDARSES